MPFCVYLISVLPLAQSTSASGPATIAAAHDEAFPHLMRAIYAIPLDTGQTLAQLFDDLPNEDLALRRILQKRARSVAERTYSDGSVDVDLAISSEHVEQAVSQIRKSSPTLQKKWPAEIHFDASSQTIVATGIGLPPMIELSFTAATSQPISQNTSTPAPVGWRHVTESARVLAADAARAHAVDRLFEQIKATPIDAGRTIRTLLLNNPGQLHRCRADLADAATFKILYDATGLCVARVDVPAQVARQWLPRSLAKKTLRQEVLSATGMAEPPPPSHNPNTPNWIDQTLAASATSRLNTPANDPDLARRAAAALAKLKLAEKIDRLVLPDGRSVRDAVLARPDLADDLRTFFIAVHSTSASDPGGRSTVTLTTSLRRLSLLLAPDHRIR